MRGSTGSGRGRRGRVSALSAAEIDRRLDAAAAHYIAGRLEAAAGLYEQVERASPGDVRAPYSLAVIDIRLGRPKRALERLKTVVRLDPGVAAAQHNLGYVAQSLSLWDEAAEAYERALALRPEAETGFSLATVLAVLGRTDAAVEQYRALAANPAIRRRALTRMAILKASAVTDAELEDLSLAARDPREAPDARTGALFALGEALEARGRDAEAFTAFAAGNRLKLDALRRTGPAPEAVAEANTRAIAAVEALFTPELIARNQARGGAEAAPIFIVGMPRSGSTLIEQILASHRDVQGLGEIGALPELLQDRYPGPSADPALFRKLADSYLKTLRERGWKAKWRPVDKTLENYLHVGAIALMFPRAVILHSARGSVDTCLACYRQLFAGGNETLYDLKQIGAEYVRYRRIMDHWRTVLPGRIVDVNLEALVADPEARIRWLVTEACGLDWDPACLKFDESPRAVESASAAQVRQPIFHTSTERWRRYADHLGPLLEALGPYAS